MATSVLDQLIAECEMKNGPKRLAVICADDLHTLEAVEKAWQKKVATPYLIGDKERISRYIGQFPGLAGCAILHAESDEQAVREGIGLVHRGEADILMKGHLPTATLLRGVVSKADGICMSGVVSHLSILDVPSYPKLLGITDAALLTYPDFEQKKQAILNAVSYMAGLVDGPVKAAVLAAVEVVNEKMPETVEARRLEEYFRGDDSCIVQGPVSYDLAVDAEAAQIKGFDSKIEGRADLLVVPNIAVGNVLTKALEFSAGAKGVGLILGARVPVIVTSRSSSSHSKYQSIAMAGLNRGVDTVL